MKGNSQGIDCLLSPLISALSGLSLPETMMDVWFSDEVSWADLSSLQLDWLPVYLRIEASVPVHSLDSSVTSSSVGVRTTFLTNFPDDPEVTSFDPDQCMLNAIYRGHLITQRQQFRFMSQQHLVQ